MQFKKLFLIKQDCWETLLSFLNFAFCLIIVSKTEILTPSIENAVYKKLFLIKLEWESILKVIYMNKTTNNT